MAKFVRKRPPSRKQKSKAGNRGSSRERPWQIIQQAIWRHAARFRMNGRIDPPHQFRPLPSTP